MNKKFILIGVIILLITSVLVAFSNNKKDYEYKANLKKASNIIIQTDLSNIILTHYDQPFSLQYKTNKSKLYKPTVEIENDNDRAKIKIKSIPKKWLYLLPGVKNRGTITINIPPSMAKNIVLTSQNGNIVIGKIKDVNELVVKTGVGNITIDSFIGSNLIAETNNGNLTFGSIEGDISFKNMTGNVDIIKMLDMKHKAIIYLGNGNITLPLPNQTFNSSFHLVTKNGKITFNNNQELKKAILTKGPGQKALVEKNSDKLLKIKVSVGNITTK